MSAVGDDRLEHVVPFIQERLEQHRKGFANQSDVSPLIVGLNGIQGCGKSTLVERLQRTLSSPPYSLHLVVFSIDDLYLPHDKQLALANVHSDNPLVQHRGQPSTHDVALGNQILRDLRANRDVEIPIYDKSAFDGQGDRVKDRCVKVDASKRNVDIVILEGWFIGFRSLDDAYTPWQGARYSAEHEPTLYSGRLGHNKWEHVSFVNESLRAYDVLTDQFNALIHVDTEDLKNVYEWRLEAEHGLRERTGFGMTDEQVRTFVDGYYPSYELYTEQLRRGTFAQGGRQLRLVVGKDRKVREIHKI